MTLTDDDTGTAQAMTTAVVSGIGLTPAGELQIVGTSGNDRTTIVRTWNTLRVFADYLLGSSFKTFDNDDVSKIVAYLCDGDDHFVISTNVKQPAIVHAGGGDDLVQAGGGPSVLLGDEGADRLNGGNARDILIGGVGRDLFMGGRGQDILLDGTTVYDANDLALMDLMTEWNSGDSYNARVQKLRDGTGITGAQLALGITVFNDTDRDRLVGSFARDWFFFDLSEDTTPDRRSNEATN